MTDPNEHIAAGWPDPRPVRATATPHTLKAILAAIATALGFAIITGVGGAVLRYELEPVNQHSGGSFAPLKDFVWAIIYWTMGGLAIGLIAGAFLGARIARRIDNPNPTEQR